jgi:hypothetical protein
MAEDILRVHMMGEHWVDFRKTLTVAGVNRELWPALEQQDILKMAEMQVK